MGDTSIPVHLAVHALGFAVSLGLAAVGAARRPRTSIAGIGLMLGGLMLAATHVTSGLLLATDMAWPVYLRVAGYAAIAVGAAGASVPVTVPAVIAMAPPSAYVAAALAGLLAAMATLRGALGRGWSAVPLATGLVLWAGADLASDSRDVLAAGLSIGGSLAAGTWLFRRSGDFLVRRFLASFLTIVLVVVVALAGLGGVVFSRDLEREQLARLEDLADARIEQFTAQWPRDVLRTALLLTGEGLRVSLAGAEGEAQVLDQEARTRAQLPGVDVVLLVTADGRAVGSWDRAAEAPLRPADRQALAGDDLVTRARGGIETVGLVTLGDREVVGAGVAPVFPTIDGQPRRDLLAGVLVVARRVTDPTVLAEIAAVGGVEASLIVDGLVAETTLSEDASGELADMVAQDRTSRVATLGAGSWFLATGVIEGLDGREVGLLVLALSANVTADLEETTARALFGAAMGGLLVAALLGVAAAVNTTRPVRTLTGAAERVAGGDLTVRVESSRTDEVGRLATSFDGMTASLARREEELRAAADTEAALRGRIEAVTSSMGEALIGVDEDGRVTSANPAAGELLEMDTERLMRANLLEVLVGSDEHGGDLADALGGPDARRAVAVRGTVSAGDRDVPVAATATPLRDAYGQLAGRVYVIRDVTAEVEAERAVTEFIANVSHELNTPLTPIKAYAQLLITKDVSREKTIEFAKVIEGRALKLERLTNVLITFAMLERGELSPEGAASLDQALQESLPRWRGDHPDRTFNRRLQRNLPAVALNPRMLAVLLDELVDNAVKFSPGTIRVLGRLEPDGRVRISVRDEGPGIEPDKIDLIRRAFRQADSSATRRYGGLGIGLPLVDRILSWVGGELLIESVADEGTEVTVLLPPA